MTINQKFLGKRRVKKTSPAIASLALLFLALPGLSASPDKSPEKSTSKPGSTQAQLSQSYPNDLTGKWESDFGPVKFSKGGGGTISGAWKEGPGKFGQIHRVKFDSKTGAVNFDFLETWSQKKGKATLKLSANHHELSGTWIRGKDKGTWTMKRPDKT